MLLLVTGASGAGKSTVRSAIAAELAPLVECLELWQVLPPTAGMNRVWRHQGAEAAVRRAIALQSQGRHLLLAGDPVAAAEIVSAPSAPALEAIAFCLLDVAPEVQAARLTARGEDPTMLHHHHAFAEWMRCHATDPGHMTHVLSEGGWEQMRWERLPGLAEAWRMQVIDTTALSKVEVADAVLDWARRALGGDAPALRLAAGA